MQVKGSLMRGDRPAKRQVAESVRQMIRAQGLRPGDLLPTYQELAKAIGVSYVTVKRGLDVLADEGLVRRVASKGTFVTKELAHTPRHLKHLGVIYPSSRQSFFHHSYLTDIMHGVTLSAPSHMDLHLFSLREDGLINAAQLAEQNVDGVILLDVGNDDYLRTFAQWGTPGVVADYWPQAAQLDHVACDNRAAAQQLVAHIAALGHRRVAFAAMPASVPVLDPHDARRILLTRASSDTRERQEECLCALRKQGLLVDELEPFAPLAAPGACAAALADRLARQRVRPTALLTADAGIASHLAEALQRRGVRVPADISVCAIAGDRDASLRTPQITHCRFDFVELGRMCMELLMARCRQPEGPPQGRRIGFAFAAGESTRQAPHQPRKRAAA